MPGRRRVFITVDGTPGRGYSLRLWVVLADGDATGSSFTSADDYMVLPLPAPAPGGSGTTWIGVVPDGVAGVRWTFECRQRPCSAVAPTDARVAVRDNVAVAQVRHAAGCAGGVGCQQPTRAVWLDRANRIVRTFSATTRLTVPPLPVVDTRIATTCDISST